MADPPRKVAFDAIKTRLLGIVAGQAAPYPTGGTATTYGATVAGCTRHAKDTNPECSGPFPYVQIWPLELKNAEQGSGGLLRRQYFDLMIFVQESDPVAVSDMLDALQEDIKACLYANPTEAEGFFDVTLHDCYEGHHPELVIGQMVMRLSFWFWDSRYRC